jgi:glycosyltransferase involved in cell wall biosynthesis
MAGFERPLRFCMVTSFYPPYSFGGDGVFVHNLSNELARRGHSVDVIHNIDAYRLLASGDPTGTYDDGPGVRAHGVRTSARLLTTLAMQQLGSPALLAAQLKPLFAGPYDVIHFHNASLMGAPETLQYGSGIKLYTMHEYWLICPTHVLFKFGKEVCREPECFTCTLRHKRPPQLWRYTDKLSRAAQHIDAFLALHQFSIDMHRARGFNARMCVLPPFVPARATHQPVAATTTPAYFLFVGRLEKIKGIHDLLPLFQGNASSELWIAGDGSERRALERQAGNHPAIRFLGHVQEPRLSQLYRNAIALIVPSLAYEVFPLVILEAFRQGTPVIVPRLGGMPDIIESVQAGFAYSTREELAARLRQLESQPELRAAMGRRAIAAFEQRWSPEVHLDRYFSIIRNLLRKERSEI